MDLLITRKRNVLNEKNKNSFNISKVGLIPSDSLLIDIIEKNPSNGISKKGFFDILPDWMRIRYQVFKDQYFSNMFLSRSFEPLRPLDENLYGSNPQYFKNEAEKFNNDINDIWKNIKGFFSFRFKYIKNLAIMMIIYLIFIIYFMPFEGKIIIDKWVLIQSLIVLLLIPLILVAIFLIVKLITDFGRKVFYRRNYKSIKITDQLTFSANFNESLKEVKRRSIRLKQIGIRVEELSDDILEVTVMNELAILFSKDFDSKNINWEMEIDEIRLIFSALLTNLSPTKLLNESNTLIKTKSNIKENILGEIDNIYYDLQKLPNIKILMNNLKDIYNNLISKEKNYLGIIIKISADNNIPFYTILIVLRKLGKFGVHYYEMPEDFDNSFVSKTIHYELLLKYKYYHSNYSFIDENKISYDHFLNKAKELDVTVEEIYKELKIYTTIGLNLPKLKKD